MSYYIIHIITPSVCLNFFSFVKTNIQDFHFGSSIVQSDLQIEYHLPDSIHTISTPICKTYEASIDFGLESTT